MVVRTGPQVFTEAVQHFVYDGMIPLFADQDIASFVDVAFLDVFPHVGTDVSDDVRVHEIGRFINDMQDDNLGAVGVGQAHGVGHGIARIF